MKGIAIFPMLVVVCLGASLRKEQWTEQNLDGHGQFTIRWYRPENTGDIEIELKVNCTGWVSLLLIIPDKSMNDILIAGYDDELEKPYVEVCSLY